MEHDIDQLIRQRILAAESLPVAWRKDSAWQKVALPALKKSRWILYYAAAVVLAGCGLAIVYKVNVDSAQTTIKSLELAINNKLEQQKVPDRVTQEVPCADKMPIAALPKKHVIPKSKPESIGTPPVVVAQVEDLKDIPEKEPMPSVAIRQDESTTPGIRAIIGYIPPDEPATVAYRKIKKSKLRFLKPPEPEQASRTTESQWTIARIN